jgi:hypothetical protein
VLYLLLEKKSRDRNKAGGYAIASYAKALELRNGKCFWRVTEAVNGRAGFRYGWKKQN